MTGFQKKLIICLAVFVALQTGVNFGLYFSQLSGGHFGGDFICFWQTAQRAHAGDIAAIYNSEKWQAAFSPGFSGVLSWFVYPPFALFGLWPLGAMSYNQAILVWSLAPLPFYFGFLLLLARRSGLGQDRTPYLILAAAALPFLSANIFTGQTGAFIAVLFLGAAYFWTRRPLLCGICIGLLAVKPQMGLLIPIALLAAGNWRAIFSAAMTFVSLSAAATMWLGAGIWSEYLGMTQLFGRFIGRGYNGISQVAVGPYVSLQGVGVPTAIAGVLQLCITLTVLCVIVRAFWRWNLKPSARAKDDGRLDLRLGLLAAGVLLATPYSLSYDTPLLMLAIVPVFARAWRSGWTGLELAGFIALLILPFAQPIAYKAHIPFAALALCLWFWASYRRYQLEGAQAIETQAPKPLAAGGALPSLA